MASILRSEEMAEIKLLPMRHHSPACALHVRQTITEWEPDAVLIEGPDNANEWIPIMVHEDTKAPFAVYYSYDDTTGQVSSDKEKYKCYYPFLDYSPELAALRAAKERGIYAAFIDMPYGEILVASESGKGLLTESEKSNYNDDYLLTRSAYVKLLCEKTGMRSFDEFWEKYFELEGLYQDSETWFENLLLHCTLSREHSTEEELRAEGCLQRETYMAGRILEIARQLGSQTSKTNRILVITGGFHTPALRLRLLPQKEREKEGVSSVQEEKLPKVPKKDQGVYMMPYSMEAADALNGYASGMPFAGFYQSVWELLEKSKEEQGEAAIEQSESTEKAVYEEAVFQYIVNCGKAVRSKEGGISTYDEICACNMVKGLAALRGKKQPGAYELQDAILSNFIKGEHNLATDFAMQQLRRLMIGKGIGELCKDANEPPILQDFRQKCKGFGFNIASTIGDEMVLSVFSKKKHRQMSKFLHQLVFLQTGFARRVKGPNLQTGRDRNLMREIWKYKWSTSVVAALIDASVYGGTVEEAVLGMVKQELKRELQARESVLLLTQVFEMGLDEQLKTVCQRMYDAILKDSDFYSLTEALQNLTMLQELCSLYQSEMDLQDLTEMCCRKAIGLLPNMTRVKEEAMAECMESMKTLYHVTSKKELPNGENLRESYLQALWKMDADREIQAGVHGCVHGMLYGCGEEDESGVEMICRGYLEGTKTQSMKVALFFRGLFFAAKDLVFVSPQFIRMLDLFLQEVPGEEFLRLLPELRLAFTYFTPGETDRIAADAAALHHQQKEDILEKQAVPEALLKYGRELDEYLVSQMSEGWYGR